MKRSRLGVIADDLTGAADSGVQFAKYGLSTLVELELSAETRPEAAAADVLVINTSSRLGTAADAGASTAAAIRVLERAGCRLFFLKVDSALRGYVGECVRSALAALPGRVALVAPAYPQQGRVTRGGTQLSHGVPVVEADAGRDEVSPARQSHLPSVLEAAGIVAVQAVAGALRRPDPDGAAPEAIVFDATDDASLAQPVRVAESREDQYVFVGAAGLAQALAAELAVRAGSGDHAEAAAAGAATTGEGGPVLTVSGSSKKISERQIAFAEAAGARVLRYPVAQLLVPGGSAAMAEEAGRHLRLAEHVIMTVSDSPDAAAPTTGEIGAWVRIAAALGDVAAQTVREAGVNDLILNGGDTALAACKRLGVGGLRLIGEALPGVPCARPLAPTLRAMRILSKSGGFGSEETLQRASEWLGRGARRKVRHA